MADTEFHPYWEGVLRPAPECVRASYWKKKGSETYLLALANWSADRVEATLSLPDFLARFQSATDPESAARIETKGELRVTIPGNDLRVAVFGP